MAGSKNNWEEPFSNKQKINDWLVAAIWRIRWQRCFFFWEIRWFGSENLTNFGDHEINHVKYFLLSHARNLSEWKILNFRCLTPFRARRTTRPCCVDDDKDVSKNISSIWSLFRDKQFSRIKDAQYSFNKLSW